MRTVVVAAFAAALAYSGPAAGADPFETARPMSTEDLEDVRAGFVDLNGVKFNFSVYTETLIDGDLKLSTGLSVQSHSAFSRSVIGDDYLISTSTFADDGVTLNLDQQTSIVHQINSDQIMNFVVTSASDQTIEQNTRIEITLQDFVNNQAAYANARTTLRLNQLLASSLTGG